MRESATFESNLFPMCVGIYCAIYTLKELQGIIKLFIVYFVIGLPGQHSLILELKLAN